MSGSFIINKALDSGVLSANEIAQLFVRHHFFRPKLPRFRLHPASYPNGYLKAFPKCMRR